MVMLKKNICHFIVIKIEIFKNRADFHNSMSIEDTISGKSDTRGEHLFDIAQRLGIYTAINFALKTSATVLGGMAGYYLAQSSGLDPLSTAIYTAAAGSLGYVGMKLILFPSHIKHAYRNAVSFFKALFGEPTQSPAH